MQANRTANLASAFPLAGSASREIESVPAEFELTILMPCLNEAETLSICIEKAKKYIARSGVKAEIVVADNGSTDGSQSIATKLGARVVPVPVRGYGAALYYGTLAARSKYVIMGDSDDSYNFEDLAPFLESLRKGSDLVMGNRFAGGIAENAMPWKNRYIGNPILTGIGRLLFDCPAKDFHCGIRGYSVEAFRDLDLRTTGMEFASEMVIKATLKKKKITEVPTTLKPDGRSRPPHLRPWRDGWRHLRFMLLYSPRWLFLYPGLVLLLAGSIALAGLAYTPIRIHGVVFDVHTMLYSATSVLIGIQLILFGIFTKVFAAAEGLLPEDSRIEKLQRMVPLEAGLVAGGLLFFAGIAGTILSILSWRSHGFGNLDVQVTARSVIPSILALAVGVQIIFASFFLSILNLKIRREPLSS